MLADLPRPCIIAQLFAEREEETGSRRARGFDAADRACVVRVAGPLCERDDCGHRAADGVDPSSATTSAATEIATEIKNLLSARLLTSTPRSLFRRHCTRADPASQQRLGGAGSPF